MPKYTVRKYGCEECGHEWESLYEVKQKPKVEDCPSCAQTTALKSKGIQEIIESKTPPMTGKFLHSKAADITQKMLEEDYGIPSGMLKDNNRAGDIAVKEVNNSVEVNYVQQGGQQSVKDFLNVGKQSQGLGESNINGLDFVKQASQMGTIKDPRKNMIAITAND